MSNVIALTLIVFGAFALAYGQAGAAGLALILAACVARPWYL